MYKLISNNENETLNLAKQFAEQLKENDIIILSGELGSGKTKFTQGILSYFNLENEISSPTFTIVNEYTSSNFSIYHFDLYRLNDIDEFYEIGGDEYFNKGGLCIIEWGEMIEPILNKNYYKITFSQTSDTSRTIIVENF